MRLYSKASSRWANECREMCVELCMEKGAPIGGIDVDVEIDETKIGEVYS